MSIECPECGERVDALPIHKCREGGDILKELTELRDWHIKTAENRVNRKKKCKHMARAYLIQAAMAMIAKQDSIIARLKEDIEDSSHPFTDPNRKNTHSR